MQGLLEAGLRLLLALAAGQVVGGQDGDVDRESFLIRYKSGDNIVPVSVRLDYKQKTEYVLSLSPQSKDKAVTFYDFTKRVIAFKHLPSQSCFIMRMRYENIHKEHRALASFQNEIIANSRPVVLFAGEESLPPHELDNLAGAKVARFCHRTKAFLVGSTKQRRRAKREAGDYSQRSYGHYGQQSQTYSHYGHDTVNNGKGSAPAIPPFNSRGFSPVPPSDPRNGLNPAAYNFQGNQRSGYELYQPLGHNGALRTFGEYGTGYGQIPGFVGDPRQLSEQLRSGIQPPTGEQILTFPLPPTQNGNDPQRPESSPQQLRQPETRSPDDRSQDSRSPDPARRDPRVHDPRYSYPGHQDSRNQDPRTYDPRYRPATSEAGRPETYATDQSSAARRDSSTSDTSRDSTRDPYPTRTQHRGAATDSESGAYAGGLSADASRRDFSIPLTFRNLSVPFSRFNTEQTLTGTGVLSNTKVTVDNQATNAVASSSGQLDDQRSQSQVQGTYAGSGSFSAQAQAGFLHGTTQSQVRGGSDGGSSISSANVERLGSAQSQVQVGTPDGKSSGSAQGNFVRGGTQAEAQGSRDAGSASAQSQSPGLSQSSATVNARGETPPRERFVGEVSASSRGDQQSGVSNTNLQGSYGNDKTYSARAEGSFNAQSSYSPLSGLPPVRTGDDRTPITTDRGRGDVPADYRYPATREPYDARRNQTTPDYRYTTTRSPYDQRGRLPIDYRYTTSVPPYDPRIRDRVLPDYRYTTTTTPTPYYQPDRERPGQRRAGTQELRQHDPHARRSGVSTHEAYYYPTAPPSTREPQTKGEMRPADPYRRRQSIFPPYSPDPRLANKGPPAPPPYPYGDQRRAYVAPPTPTRAPVYPDYLRQQPPSETKSQVAYPPHPQRAYVFPDPRGQPPQSQTKSQISYPAPPARAYVFQQPSQTKSQVPYPPTPTQPRRAYVHPEQQKGQVSCCRTRRGQRQPCCDLVPHAECCNSLRRDESSRTRRYLSEDKENRCQPTCYIVYKTIGQAKICQPRNC